MMKFGTTFVYNVSPRSECVGTCSDQILQALSPLMQRVHASGLISQRQTIQRRMPDCPAECAGLSNEPLGNTTMVLEVGWKLDARSDNSIRVFAYLSC